MLNIFCLSEIEGGKTHVALYMIELYNYKTEGGKTMAFIEKKICFSLYLGFEMQEPNQ